MICGRPKLPSASVNEERRGSNQCAIVDLLDEEVCDIGATDNAKSPFLAHTQDAVATSRGAAGQKSRPHDGPVEPRGPNNPFLHVLVVIDPLQEQGKDDPIVEDAAMTAAVSGAKTRHRDEPLDPRGLHGVDQDACRSREKRCRFDDGSKGDVDPERLDNHVSERARARTL
jgi:hypothetical protein